MDYEHTRLIGIPTQICPSAIVILVSIFLLILLISPKKITLVKVLDKISIISIF